MVPNLWAERQLSGLLDAGHLPSTLESQHGCGYLIYLLFRAIAERAAATYVTGDFTDSDARRFGIHQARKLFAKQTSPPPAKAIKDASLLDDYDLRPSGQSQEDFASDHKPSVELRTLQRRIQERRERTPGTDRGQLRDELEEMREELKLRAEVGREAKKALLKIRPDATNNELDAAAGKAIQEMFPSE